MWLYRFRLVIPWMFCMSCWYNYAPVCNFTFPHFCHIPPSLFSPSLLFHPFLPTFLAEDFNIIQQEIAIIADSSHPNIIGYVGTYLR